MIALDLTELHRGLEHANRLPGCCPEPTPEAIAAQPLQAGRRQIDANLNRDTADKVAKMQAALRELTAHMTIGQALDIVRRWGNRRYRVPHHVGPDDPLALTLGLKCAQRFVHACAGQELYLPAERHALRQFRDQAIWTACIEQGRSQSEVALEFGLTRQAVGLLLAKMRASREDAEPADL